MIDSVSGPNDSAGVGSGVRSAGSAERELCHPQARKLSKETFGSFRVRRSLRRQGPLTQRHERARERVPHWQAIRCPGSPWVLGEEPVRDVPNNNEFERTAPRLREGMSHLEVVAASATLWLCRRSTQR